MQKKWMWWEGKQSGAVQAVLWAELIHSRKYPEQIVPFQISYSIPTYLKEMYLLKILMRRGFSLYFLLSGDSNGSNFVSIYSDVLKVFHMKTDR